jgi:hypothetical protein
MGAGPIASTVRSNRCAIALAPLRVTTLLVSLNRVPETVFRARLRIRPAGGHPYPEAGPINQVVSGGTAVDAALALAEDRWRLRRSVSPYRRV